MRKTIWQMSISLDGFIEGEDATDMSWHRIDAELHHALNAELRERGAFVNGGRIHRLMAAYWPEADVDPNASAHAREFAPIWREVPKVVFSRTLEDSAWNTTIVREFDVAVIDALKAQPGGDIAIGGADIGNLMLRAGRVDEVLVYVHPVLIGRGKPLFENAPADLELLSHRRFGNGVVRLHYSVGGAGAARTMNG